VYTGSSPRSAGTRCVRRLDHARQAEHVQPPANECEPVVLQLLAPLSHDTRQVRLLLTRNGLEQSERVRHHSVEGLDQSSEIVVSAHGNATNELVSVLDVEPLLMQQLGRHIGDVLVERVDERCESQPVGVVLAPVSRESEYVVRRGQLANDGMAILMWLTTESDRVHLRPSSNTASGSEQHLIPEVGMIDLVLRDRREGEILLERGREPCPGERELSVISSSSAIATRI
jgi:hypothetical protein